MVLLCPVSNLKWEAGFSTLSSPAFRLIRNLISVQMPWWRIHEVLHRNISSTRRLSPDPDYWRERSVTIHALKVSGRGSIAWFHYSLNKDHRPLSSSLHADRGCDWVTPKLNWTRDDICFSFQPYFWTFTFCWRPYSYWLNGY